MNRSVLKWLEDLDNGKLLEVPYPFDFIPPEGAVQLFYAEFIDALRIMAEEFDVESNPILISSRVGNLFFNKEYISPRLSHIVIKYIHDGPAFFIHTMKKNIYKNNSYAYNLRYLMKKDGKFLISNKDIKINYNEITINE